MKNKVRKILMIFSCLIGLSFTLSAQNPYLPLWEFIPDGEPYVFVSCLFCHVQFL